MTDNERVDAILVYIGGNRVSAIKLVREVTGLGTAEAKHLIENVPQKVRENVTREEGESLRSRFEDVECWLRLDNRKS